MSPFGYLAEQASLTGNEPNSQLDDMTSNNFASVQGDSGMTLCLTSFHLTECVVTMIPAGDRHPESAHGNKNTNAGSLQEKHGAHERGKSFEILDDLANTKVTKPFIRSNTRKRTEWLRNSGKQTTTQLNAGFRIMEFDTSVEKDEFNRIQMQEFANQADEQLVLKETFSLRKHDKKSDDEKMLMYLVNYLKNKLHTQRLESSSQSYNFEAIEADLQRRLCHAEVECRSYVERYDEFRSEFASHAPERHRLQDEQSFLTFGARKRDNQHHQEVTILQKNLETTFKQSQEPFEKIRSLPDEKLMLRKGLTALGQLSQSMKNLTASEIR